MTTRTVRRRWIYLVPVAAVLTLLAVGMVIGARVKSPEQAAAEAKPPPRSLVTTHLEMRTLRTSIVSRGRPAKAVQYNVTAPPSLGGSDAVVTAVKVSKGDRLRDGAVVLEVSGEPVVTADLPFRFYRDITVGTRGPDVSALSRFLVRRGYLAKKTDTAGAGLRTAVRKFFKDRGYPYLLDDDPAPTTAPPKEPAGAVTDPSPGVGDSPSSALVIKQNWFLRIDHDNHKVDVVGTAVGQEIGSADRALFVCDKKAPALQTRVDQDGAKRLKVGDTATVTDESTSKSADAKVVSVGRTLSTDATTGVTGVLVTLRAAPGSTFAGLADDLKVTIEAAVAPRPVLVAPAGAIYTDQAGYSRVVVADGDARGAEVSVELGECVEGWCQITSSPTPLDDRTVVVLGDS